MKADSWSRDAGHRLRKFCMRAVTLGKNFAPDQTYELSKRGQVGPKSAAIAKILQQHADLWAQEMRDSERDEIRVDADARFAAEMREAEASIGRYLAGEQLTTGAAA